MKWRTAFPLFSLHLPALCWRCQKLVTLTKDSNYTVQVVFNLLFFPALSFTASLEGMQSIPIRGKDVPTLSWISCYIQIVEKTGAIKQSQSYNLILLI